MQVLIISILAFTRQQGSPFENWDIEMSHDGTNGLVQLKYADVSFVSGGGVCLTETKHERGRGKRFLE